MIGDTCRITRRGADQDGVESPTEHGSTLTYQRLTHRVLHRAHTQALLPQRVKEDYLLADLNSKSSSISLQVP